MGYFYATAEKHMNSPILLDEYYFLYFRIVRTCSHELKLFYSLIIGKWDLVLASRTSNLSTTGVEFGLHEVVLLVVLGVGVGSCQYCCGVGVFNF